MELRPERIIFGQQTCDKTERKKKELEVLYVKAEMRDTIKEEQIKTGQIFFLIYSFILF